MASWSTSTPYPLPPTLAAPGLRNDTLNTGICLFIGDHELLTLRDLVGVGDLVGLGDLSIPLRIAEKLLGDGRERIAAVHLVLDRCGRGRLRGRERQHTRLHST